MEAQQVYILEMETEDESETCLDGGRGQQQLWTKADF